MENLGSLNSKKSKMIELSKYIVHKFRHFMDKFDIGILKSLNSYLKNERILEIYS